MKLLISTRMNNYLTLWQLRAKPLLIGFFRICVVSEKNYPNIILMSTKQQIKLVSIC